MVAGDLLAQLERRVERLRSTHSELRQPIQIQAALTRQRLSSSQAPIVTPFPMPLERAAFKLGSGTPLLHGEPAIVDVNFAADLFGRMLNALLDLDIGRDGADFMPLVEAMKAGALDAHHLFGEAFVQHREHLWQAGASIGIDPDQLTSLALLAVAPVLAGYAERLRPLLERAKAAWTSGYCPICGAWAMLAELRRPDWQRHLRCYACGTAWLGREPRCAFCGNQDPATRHHLELAGEKRFAVETCDRCRGYLKVARSFEPSPAELLAFDDLASFHLDVAAQEREYLRPTTSGFHLELAIPEDEWAEDLASMDFD